MTDDPKPVIFRRENADGALIEELTVKPMAAPPSSDWLDECAAELSVAYDEDWTNRWAKTLIAEVRRLRDENERPAKA